MFPASSNPSSWDALEQLLAVISHLWIALPAIGVAVHTADCDDDDVSL